MPESDIDFIIRLILVTIIGIGFGIFAKYMIDHYHGKLKINGKSIEITLENKWFKYNFYSWFLVYIFFLCAMVYVEFIQTHMETSGIPTDILIMLTVITGILALLAWGNKIRYNGIEISKKSLWSRNINNLINNIDKIYSTDLSTVIKFYDGNEIKIPDGYTNVTALLNDLRDKIPNSKWDL